jgi:1,4-alpha-glucan branching enzyme
VVRGGYRLGVIGEGFYEEVLNTDAETYGGSNVGNYGGRWAEPISWQGRGWSIQADLPPLSVLAFKRTAGKNFV